MAFEILDYIVFGGSLFISAGIGLYCKLKGNQKKTNEEYLVGNRKQNPIIIAVTLMTSFKSAVAMLGDPAEVFTYGTQFFTFNLGYLIGIVLGLILYIPVFYDLNQISLFKYLELRFGRSLSLCASGAFVVQTLLYTCIALVAPAISLQIVTGISHECAVIVTGLVVTFYATLGGMKAIIFTDLFQAFLMYSALFSIIYTGYFDNGGFWSIINIADKHGRIVFNDFRIDPTIRYSFLSTIVGGISNSLILKAISQAQMQRYLTMKNYRNVTISALLSWPLITALSGLTCFSGLIAFAKYDCDPIKMGRIPKADYLLPLYVLDTFSGSGLAGIFVSGVFSASLSTISPLFNSLAAVTLEDFIKPLVKKCRGSEMDPKSSLVTQILTCFYGIVSILLALMALSVSSIIQAATTIYQIIGGPLLAVYSLGMFTLSANQKGTAVGYFAGLLAGAFLCFGQPKPKPVSLPPRIDGCLYSHFMNVTTASPVQSSNNYPYLFRISFMYYALIGFTVTFVVGYICSFILKSKSQEDLDPKLFIKPIAERIRKQKSSLTSLDDSYCKEETSSQKAK